MTRHEFAERLARVAIAEAFRTFKFQTPDGMPAVITMSFTFPDGTTIKVDDARPLHAPNLTHT